MKQRNNTGDLQNIKQTVSATLLHSMQIAPGHDIKFYEFEDSDVGVNEILNLDQHSSILQRINKNSLSAVELFRLISPKAEVPESLVKADQRSASAKPDNIAIEDEEGTDGDAIAKPPVSKQLLDPESALAAVTCVEDGHWHSWECDEQWFLKNFCNTGDKKFCPTNVQGWAWSQKTGSQMHVTGMAAGFDTVARFVIKRRKCSLFDGCSWHIYTDETLLPRTYSHWYFSKHRKRHGRIDTIKGEPRIHFAMTCNSGSTPAQAPPSISVSANLTNGSRNGSFTVTGSGFLANTTVNIRVVDDALTTIWLAETSTAQGTVKHVTGKLCQLPGRLHFSANDGRSNPADVTGTLWSNTVTTTCS